MKKVDVIKLYSVTRGASECVTAALRGTANRMQHDRSEVGPDPQRPWIIPLSHDERKEQIALAWWWSSLLMQRAQRAHTELTLFCEQNGVTQDDLKQVGKERGFVS